MKHLLSILTLFLFSINTFATEQEADLLINGKDTIYLKTFPLESLKLNVRPFGNSRSSAPSTACWRGYRAVWKIEDDKIYLEKIIRCYSDKQSGEEDIIQLFQKNGLNIKIKEGMILADWYTQDFYRMKFSIARYYKDKVYLCDGWYDKKKENKVVLRIEKGIVTKKQLNQ